MNLDVLAANVGKDGVVAMSLCLKNQGSLASLPALTEKASAEMQAELHWHVDPSPLLQKRLALMPCSFEFHRKPALTAADQ